MITDKIYRSLSDREWRGKRLRLLRPVQNTYVILPAGTIVTVKRKFKGFEIEGEACRCCGVRVRMTKVLPQSFEVVEGLA
jgi:hypothetical protein